MISLRIPLHSFVLCALLLSWKVALAQSSHAPLPRTLSYQGVLRQPDGAQTPCYRVFTISLYADPAADSLLWRDEFRAAIDSSGVFNIELGSGAVPLPDAHTMDCPLWLGLEVDHGLELRPLSRLTASAYALNVVDNSITTAKLADNAVTTSKIADSSITLSKMNLPYVSSITVNGQPVTGSGTGLNIVTGNGLNAQWIPSQSSLILTGRGGDSGNTVRQVIGDSAVGGAKNTCGTNYDGGIGSNTISGGCLNKAYATGGYATIGGGYGNYIDSVAAYGTIAGGQNNTSHNPNSFIGSGKYNNIGRWSWTEGFPETDDTSSAIVAGDSNDIEEGWGFIGGGARDSIESTSYYSSIIGGIRNKLSFDAENSSITGGMQNTVYDHMNAIVGGSLNKIDFYSQNAFIGGGDTNYIQGYYNTIVGGHSNSATDASTSLGASFIGAGTGNTIKGDGHVIAGGDTNTVDGSALSAIGGGAQNTITGKYSAIPGGRNLTIGNYSFGFNAGSSTDVSDSANIAYLGNTNLWLGNVDGAARSLRFYSPNSSPTLSGAHFSSFQAGSQTSNVIYTLPVSTPDSVGRVLGVSTITGSDVSLAWIGAGSGGGGGLFWSLTGNAHTVAGANFIGTTDSQAFEIHVLDTGGATGGNKRVMRYQEGSSSPDIIGGSSSNVIGTGLSGASILSGGTAGGSNGEYSNWSVVAGGVANGISAHSDYSAIVGGNVNLIDTDAQLSIIGGGASNYISAPFCFIGGGGGYFDGGPAQISFSPPAAPSRTHSRPSLSGSSSPSGLSVFRANQAKAPWATIGGGYENVVTDTAGSILGGAYNTSASSFATVVGGNGNVIGSSPVVL